MQKKSVNILTQLEPEIKPEGQFRQSETGHSGQKSPQKKAGKISHLTYQRERSALKRKCCQCGSTNLKNGAGLKPGEESLKCLDCGKFLGYLPIEPLKRPKKRRKPGLEPISAILARLEIGGES